MNIGNAWTSISFTLSRMEAVLLVVVLFALPVSYADIHAISYPTKLEELYKSFGDTDAVKRIGESIASYSISTFAFKNNQKINPYVPTKAVRDYTNKASQNNFSTRQKRGTFLPPGNPRLRKEYRMMSNEERNTYHFCMNKLKFNTTVDDMSGYEALQSLHKQDINAHGGVSFLAWHRVYLWALENALRNLGGACSQLTLPYWDCTAEFYANNIRADSARHSSIFSDQFAGSGTGYVQDGPFKDWGLFRQVAEQGDLFGRARIEELKTHGTNDLIANPFSFYSLENDHNGIHRFVGGGLLSITLAPRDPIFFLLHCYIDYVWEEIRQAMIDRGLDPSIYPWTWDDDHSGENVMSGFPSWTNAEGYSDQWYESHVQYQPSFSCQHGTCNNIEGLECVNYLDEGQQCMAVPKEATDTNNVITTTPPNNVITTTPPNNVITTTPPNNDITTTTLNNDTTPTPPNNDRTTAPPINDTTTTPPNNDTTTAPPNNDITTTTLNDTPTTPPNNDITTAPPNNDTTTTPPNNDITTAPPNNDITTTTLNNDTTTTPPNNDITTTTLNNDTTTTPSNNDITTAPPNNDITTIPPNNDTTTPPNNDITTTTLNNDTTTTPRNNDITTTTLNNDTTTTPRNNDITTTTLNNDTTTTPPNNDITTAPLNNDITTAPTNIHTSAQPITTLPWWFWFVWRKKREAIRQNSLNDTSNHITRAIQPKVNVCDCRTCPSSPTSLQNTYTINYVTDATQWVYIRVKVVYKRPKGLKFHTFASYSGKTAPAINSTMDIFDPAFNSDLEKHMYTGEGRPYESCRINDAGSAKIYIRADGINYSGTSMEYAIVDERYPLTSQKAFIPIKDPTVNRTDVCLMAYDSCGRLCLPTCHVKGTQPSAYKPCTGCIRVNNKYPRMYGRSVADIVANQWSFNKDDNTEFLDPVESDTDTFLKFVCDASSKFPWQRQKF